MHTPRRPETGRPRAAQFASPAVYIRDGKRDRVREMVTMALVKLSGDFPHVRQEGPALFDEARIPVDGYYD
jgi:hypothetical protein